MSFVTTTAQLIGPLTTTFVAPSDCNYLSFVREYRARESTVGGNDLGRPSMYAPMLESGTRCFPPGILTTKGYYSPGICPSDWVALSATKDSASDLDTTYNCCPSVLPSADANLYTQFPPLVVCYKNIALSSTPTTVALYSMDGSFRQYTTAGTSNYKDALFVEGAGIQVRFKDSEVQVSGSVLILVTTTQGLPPTASNSFNVPRVTSAATTATTADPNGSLSPDVGSSRSSSSSRLSKGATTGIGVGVALAAIVICAILFFLIRRRRNRRNSSTEDSAIEESHIQGNSKAELPGTISTRQHLSPTPVIDKHELDDGAKTVSPVVEKETFNDDHTHGRVELNDTAASHRDAELPNEDIRKQTQIAELDAQNHLRHELPSSTNKQHSEIVHGELNDQMASTSMTDTYRPSPLTKSENSRPLPTASETYPTVTSAAHDEDDDLEYEERKLRARRDLIAEKELLARDEEALRERRAKRKGASGGK